MRRVTAWVIVALCAGFIAAIVGGALYYNPWAIPVVAIMLLFAFLGLWAIMVLTEDN